MYNKKNRRIMTTVLVVILVLAMVVPLLISAISRKLDYTKKIILYQEPRGN